MRTKHEVVRLKARKRYLEVMVEVSYPGTKRWVALKVPWRMLNEHYEDVSNYMAVEAQEELHRLHGDTPLPLEKWE